MKKHYLYLIHNKGYTKSKVGYTFSKNPLNRLKQYITHNPEINIDLRNIFEVPEKVFEKLVQMGLLKKYKKVKTKGQKEWYEGNITKNEVKNIIADIEERGFYKLL
jgi:gamma-glutamyltranspeptidase